MTVFPHPANQEPMNFTILGIESSCDETSAAIVRKTPEGLQLLSDVTARQEEVHERWGGVVPELASRKHLENLLLVVKLSLEKAGINYSDLDAVAVTNRPGLIGSLIVGVSAAKTIAYSMNLPLIPINHLEAHLAAVLLETKELSFPALGLIISGGHTSLYEIGEDWQNFRPLAHTRDDAAGEAFDKGARLLALPYPGGPAISKLAAAGNPNAYHFPRALPAKDIMGFSFSGLKTSLSTFLASSENQTAEKIPDICASYQEAIVDALVKKTLLALKQGGYRHLIVAGGVAANQRLREKLKTILPIGCRLHIPSPQFCTDNGAMIAAMGAIRFEQKNFLRGEEIFTLEPSPRTEAKNARGKTQGITS